jgi:hypothetical protein
MFRGRGEHRAWRFKYQILHRVNMRTRSGSFRPELSVDLETCKATFRFYKPESATAVTRDRSFLTSQLHLHGRVQITYTDPGQTDPVCRARNAARCSVQGRLDS